MTGEKILTQHPQGKTGRNISREAYELFKKAIVDTLRNGELSHNELMTRLNQDLNSRFDGNIGWYAETVKLDLEARNIIERSKEKPPKYRVK
jgi:hypothetical protein